MASSNPMLDARPVLQDAGQLLVITSDKGLLEVILNDLKAVLTWLNVTMILKMNMRHSIGGTGFRFLHACNMNVALNFSLEDQPSFDQVGKIISKAVGMYQNELFDELYAITTMLDSLSSEVREQMLPIAYLDPNESAIMVDQVWIEPDRINYFGSTLATICWES